MARQRPTRGSGRARHRSRSRSSRRAIRTAVEVQTVRDSCGASSASSPNADKNDGVQLPVSRSRADRDHANRPRSTARIATYNFSLDTQGAPAVFSKEFLGIVELRRPGDSAEVTRARFVVSSVLDFCLRLGAKGWTADCYSFRQGSVNTNSNSFWAVGCRTSTAPRIRCSDGRWP